MGETFQRPTAQEQSRDPDQVFWSPAQASLPHDARDILQAVPGPTADPALPSTSGFSGGKAT
jgi:hypothetical protein